MEPILRFFYRKFVAFNSWKDTYLFEKRKKHYVSAWGEKSYGAPRILRYDDESKLSVGKYVSIASNVTVLLGSNHKRGLITTYPYSGIDAQKSPQETNERGDVHIGNDVWIGYGATLIGDVTIGDGAIIGAGAVVVNNIPPYAVAVGVPARVVKYRFDEASCEALLKIKWWDFGPERVKEISKDLYSSDIQSFLRKYQR